MNKLILSITTLAIFCFSQSSFAQKKTVSNEKVINLNDHKGALQSKQSISIPKNNKVTTPKSIQEKSNNNIAEDNIDGFLETENGLLYKFVKKGNTSKKAKVKDEASLHIVFKLGDTTIINTKILNDGKPVAELLKQPNYVGDVNEGLLMMGPGDEAIFKLPLKVLEANTGQKLPPFVKNGNYATWNVIMTDLKTQEEIVAEEGKLVEKEDIIIKEYLEKNKLKYERTEEGIYIVKHQSGDGNYPPNGKNVVVNYTGRLMDGTVFDSNVDPKFNHVSPFEFPLGTGRVIKGWDIAVAKMTKGEKVTVYIPSKYAYGKRSQGPIIPANSILVFDIELTEF